MDSQLPGYQNPFISTSWIKREPLLNQSWDQKIANFGQKISNFEKKNHQLWAKKITAFFEMASSQFKVSKSIPDHQYPPGKTRLLWWCRNKWISDWGGSLFGLQLLSKMAPTFDQKWHQLWSKVVPTFVQKCSQLLVKKWGRLIAHPPIGRPYFYIIWEHFRGGGSDWPNHKNRNKT